MELLEALHRVLTVGHHLDTVKEAKEEKRKKENEVTIMSIILDAFAFNYKERLGC